jgi:small subunit ribosomal protein S5
MEGRSPALQETVEAAGRQFEERVIDIWRCACVVKGGRRFSFAAMAVVGNGDCVAGVGYGKAKEVPSAIEKAVKDAKKHLERFCVINGTVPHEVRGHYGSAKVALIPAMPGTGVIAGDAVRAVAESLGVRNLLSKSFGKNNAKNLVRATFDAFRRLRSYEQVLELRGVPMEYQQTKVDRVGAPVAAPVAPPPAAFTMEGGDDERRPGRPGRGRPGGRRPRGPRPVRGAGEAGTEASARAGEPASPGKAESAPSEAGPAAGAGGEKAAPEKES